MRISRIHLLTTLITTFFSPTMVGQPETVNAIPIDILGPNDFGVGTPWIDASTPSAALKNIDSGPQAGVPRFGEEGAWLGGAEIRRIEAGATGWFLTDNEPSRIIDAAIRVPDGLSLLPYPVRYGVVRREVWNRLWNGFDALAPRVAGVRGPERPQSLFLLVTVTLKNTSSYPNAEIRLSARSGSWTGPGTRTINYQRSGTFVTNPEITAIDVTVTVLPKGCWMTLYIDFKQSQAVAHNTGAYIWKDLKCRRSFNELIVSGTWSVVGIRNTN